VTRGHVEIVTRHPRCLLRVIKSRTRRHRLMTAVPSIAEVPARPGRGTGPRHTADHCRLGPTNACLRRPALIVAECKKRLEFLDCETIANRRSWTWADETVRFLVAGPNPGCDRAIERMWGKDRCTRRNPPKERKVGYQAIQREPKVRVVRSRSAGANRIYFRCRRQTALLGCDSRRANPTPSRPRGHVPCNCSSG
jgi:hypothetical protein